jgi:hypothetical protein
VLKERVRSGRIGTLAVNKKPSRDNLGARKVFLLLTGTYMGAAVAFGSLAMTHRFVFIQYLPETA